MSVLNVFSDDTDKTKANVAFAVGGAHFEVYSLPAGIGCPCKGECYHICFARTGRQGCNTAQNAYAENLMMALDGSLRYRIWHKISSQREKAEKKNGILFVRIHDSGDFITEDYLDEWLWAARTFPDVIFYAYTKRISLFKRKESEFPSNFIYTYSYGGKQDHLIDREHDAHVVVLADYDVPPRGYVDGSDHDFNVILGHKKIFIRCHGNLKKNFRKD